MSYVMDDIIFFAFRFVDVWSRVLFLFSNGIISCAMQSLKSCLQREREERKESRIDEGEKNATKVDKGQILVSS